MTLRLSVEAEQDIIDIYTYGATTFGLAQAERYHADLRSALDIIERTPQIAHERAELSPPVRIHPHRRHLIIYTISEHDVLVIRIVGYRQNWAGILLR